MKEIHQPKHDNTISIFNKCDKGTLHKQYKIDFLNLRGKADNTFQVFLRHDQHKNVLKVNLQLLQSRLLEFDYLIKAL